MKNSIVCHQQGKDPLYKTWHASTTHLIMYFYSDGGSIVCADEVFPIKKGGLIFIAADTYHYTMPDVPEIYDRSKLHISCCELDKVLEQLSENNKFKSFSNKAIVYAEIGEESQKEVDRIFNEFLRYCEIPGVLRGIPRKACTNSWLGTRMFPSFALSGGTFRFKGRV